jgi:uncharacterized protein
MSAFDLDSADRVVGRDWIHRDGDTVTVTRTRCTVCDRTWFPPLEICAGCGSLETVPEHSESGGVVYASTLVHIGPPTFPAPYVLSYVDVGSTRLLAHTLSDTPLEPGTVVRLDTGQIGTDDSGAVGSYVVLAQPQESDPR